MKYSSSFTHDLEFGESAEDWVHQLFTGAKGFKIEVKLDSISHITGNVFIEYISRGKPSGISTTDADYWIYKIAELNSAIILDVSNLKDKLRFYHRNNMYIKRGGDNDTSIGFLIPISELLKQ